MKRLLNNKWFVVGLGSVAAAVFGFNVFVPLIERSDSTAHPEVAPVGLPGAGGDLLENAQNSIVTDATHMTDGHGARFQTLNKLGWNNEPKRDPFTLPGDTDATAAVVILDAQEKLHEQQTQIPQPQVAALVITSEFQLAVVDGQVVHDGSKLSPGRVTGISPAGVEISFDDDTTRTLVPSVDTP